MSTVLVRVVPVVEPVDSDWAVLDEDEVRRAARRADPRAFVTVHAALRRLLAEHVHCPPADVTLTRYCPTCGSSRHGKPLLRDHPEVQVSLSYGETLAVIGLTEDGPLGVDIEDTRTADFAGFDHVTLAPVEGSALDGLTGQDLLFARATVWARKEAVLKATAHGLVVDPVDLVVTGPAEPPRLLAWTATQPAPTGLSMADLDLADGAHAGAVAVLGKGPIEVRRV